MRQDLADAISEACQQYLGDRIGVGAPVRIKGTNVRRSFMHRLRAVVRELPDDMTVRELRDELGD